MKPQGRLWLGLLLASSLGAQARPLELNDAYPSHYLVRQGDTLWDISARFLRSPWQWPRLWRANPQLSDPHAIYPGDELRLTWVDGQPRLVRAEPAGVVRLSPRVRVAPAVATIPLAAIMSFTDSHRVLAPEQLVRAPYILGESQGRVIMNKDESLYVRGQLNPGETYGVYRSQGELTDKFSRAELGLKAVQVGTVLAREQLEEGLARATVSSLRQEMRQGDRLLPLAADGAIAAFHYPRPGPALDKAYILAMGQEGAMTGRHGVVFINKGSEDGLGAGDLYRVLRPGPGVYDYGDSALARLSYADSASRYLRNTGPAVPLPAIPIARLLVFSVHPRVSAALVLDSDEPVRPHFPLDSVHDAGLWP
ncbi:LysM peptidoglycan-binding domain-containing protein [Zobellella sp. An-6]|uniref:LysM peptidoglycan-binding domain-containing protein n=1 Tax=Zobellella sp. An-6 TaxID=3400218 RepID=UPI0040433B86